MQTTFQCLICSSIRIENNLTYQTTHRGFPGLRWLPSSEVPTIFPQDFSSFSVATAVLGQVLMIWNHFRCVPPVEGWFTCLNWSNTRFWGATQELIVLFEHWRENRADLLVNHICSYSHGQSGDIPLWDVNPDHLVGCTTYLHCIPITQDSCWNGSNELDSEQIIDLSTRLVVFHIGSR